jgi:tRNA pseudouridine55 synthase
VAANRNRRLDGGPTGVLLIDKTAGCTSHDVVNRVRRLFGTRRAGHTGTLDPDATGLLVVCIGDATRIAEYLTAKGKAYTASAQFGIVTDTQDVSGRVLSQCDTPGLTAADVERCLKRFRGEILQVPPMFSALKVEGRKLVDLARSGVEIERSPRRVRVDRLTMTEFSAGPAACATLQLECSSGFYVRTLIHDLGEALGVGAAMSSLRRTRVGRHTVESAVALATLETMTISERLERLIPLLQAVPEWPAPVLGGEEIRMLAQGRALPKPGVPEADLVWLADECGHPFGLGELRAGQLLPRKVFASAAEAARGSSPQSAEYV